MKAKVIIFARVSSTQQDYNRQINDLKPLIKADGYKEKDIYVIKHKESATKNDVNNRKSIAELKEVIENNPIEAVYCTEASRLARRGDVLYSVLALLEERTISLVIQTPTLIRTFENGKSNPLAHVVIAFLGQVAQQEMELKKERQRSGLAQKIKEGKVCSPKMIFGYDRDKNGYAVINDEKAAVVVDIFNLYLADNSVASIWAKYKHSGIFEKVNSDKYSWNMIGNILRNRTYIGENEHYNYPSIINEELFNAVQQKMDNNRLVKSQTKHVYYSRGMLKVDGHTMTPMLGDISYVYRDLTTKKQIGININAADSLLWNLAVTAKLQMDRVADDKRKENIKKELALKEKKLKGIAEAIEDNTKQTDRANDLFIMGKLTENKYSFVIEDLEGQLDQLLREQSTLQKNKVELSAVLKKADNQTMQDIMDYQTLSAISDDALRQEIVKEAIDYVEVKQIERGTLHLFVHYNDHSLNDDTYYVYKQSGRRKQLFCCYEGYYEDWTDGIEDRIKRTKK